MSNNRILVYLKNELPFVCMPLIGCAIPISLQVRGMVDYSQIMQFNFVGTLPYLVFLPIAILGACLFIYRVLCCLVHCIILSFKQNNEMDVPIKLKADDVALPEKQVNESSNSIDFAHILFGLWLAAVVVFALCVAAVALIAHVPVLQDLLLLMFPRLAH